MRTPKIDDFKPNIESVQSAFRSAKQTADENFKRNLQILKYVKHLEKNRGLREECPICLELPLSYVSKICLDRRRNSFVHEPQTSYRNVFYIVVIKCVVLVSLKSRNLIPSNTLAIHAEVFKTPIIHTCKTF